MIQPEFTSYSLTLMPLLVSFLHCIGTFSLTQAMPLTEYSTQLFLGVKSFTSGTRILKKTENLKVLGECGTQGTNL